jgi:hypothetical protein
MVLEVQPVEGDLRSEVHWFANCAEDSLYVIVGFYSLQVDTHADSLFRVAEVYWFVEVKVLLEPIEKTSGELCSVTDQHKAFHLFQDFSLDFFRKYFMHVMNDHTDLIFIELNLIHFHWLEFSYFRPEKLFEQLEQEVIDQKRESMIGHPQDGDVITSDIVDEMLHFWKALLFWVENHGRLFPSIPYFMKETNLF